ITKHSDKTKDMPKNGLIVFCTFLKDLDKFPTLRASETDPYDLIYGKNMSVLSKLRFVRKSETPEIYPQMFEICLYPNSVFAISLETNRLYTHEICPSVLPIEHLPVRMGYVIRCS